MDLRPIRSAGSPQILAGLKLRGRWFGAGTKRCAR